MMRPSGDAELRARSLQLVGEHYQWRLGTLTTPRAPRPASISIRTWWWNMSRRNVWRLTGS